MTNKFSLDLLGGAKYPEVVKTSRCGCLGIFFDVDGFGSSLSLIKWAVTSGRFEAIRVHGVWKDDHVFGAAEEELGLARAKVLQAIATTSPIPVYYSIFCEHKKSANAMTATFKKVRAVAPNLILVNTPVEGGQWVNGEINEIHHEGKPEGMPSGEYFFSFDGKVNTGNGSVDCDIEAYKRTHARAKYFFFWVTQFNGTKNAKKDSKKPRRERTAWPSQRLVTSIYYQRHDRGEMTLPPSVIFKSHSEQSGENTDADLKANKVAIIVPMNAKRLQIVTTNGTVLATVTTNARYVHGTGFLYRFTKFGYEYAEAALKATGKRTCKLVADGKSLGLMNPAFRGGKPRTMGLGDNFIIVGEDI